MGIIATFYNAQKKNHEKNLYEIDEIFYDWFILFSLFNFIGSLIW